MRNPGEKGTSSPVASGGGGVTFERRVTAHFLALMLTGESAVELGWRIITEVSFQQAPTYPVDDMVITTDATDNGSSAIELAVAIKRDPKIVSSSDDAKKLFADFVFQLERPLQAGVERRLGLAVAGDGTQVQEVSRLAELARDQPDSPRFHELIHTEGKISQRLRDRLMHIKGLVRAVLAARKTAPGDPLVDQRTWELLERLYVIQLRVEGSNPRDRDGTIRLLRSVARGRTPAAAEQLLDRLEVLAGQYAPNAARVDGRMLRRDVGGLLDPSADRPRADGRAFPHTGHNLPDLHSTVLVGRERELKQLERSLGGGVVTVVQNVAGLGGVGKTTLVLSYAHAHVQEYAGVWWLDASTATTLERGLADLARLSATGAQEFRETDREAAARAVGELQTSPGWLLVLDNADHPDTVSELLGQLRNRGTILITSRCAEFTSASLVPLAVLDRSDSVALLAARSDRDATAPLASAEEVKAARGIADFLGGLPLALEHAAAYIRTRRFSYGLYLEKLRENPRASLTRVPFGNRPDTAVAKTWNVTMDLIARDNPLALKILQICAYYAADAIPRDLLAPLGADDPAAVDDALALLAAYSMISLDEDVLAVHRLVQTVTRTGAREGGADEVRVKAVELMDRAVPGDPADWQQWRRLIAHVHALAANTEPAADDIAAASLLQRTVRYLSEEQPLAREVGRNIYNEYLGRAASAYERILGPMERETLVARRWHAWYCKDLDVVMEVGADLERAFGADDADFLVSLHDQAWRWFRPGEYRLDVRRALLTTIWPGGLTRSGRSALSRHLCRLRYLRRLSLVGHWFCEGAEELFRQALVGQQRLPDELCNQFFATQYGLGYVLHTIGRFSEAQEILADCAEQRSRLLSPLHPHTLITKRLLGVNTIRLGRFGEAKTILQETLEAQQRVFRENHSEIRETQAWLNKLQDFGVV
jgi:Tetratricopeptide repeat/NB-ARC domain